MPPPKDWIAFIESLNSSGVDYLIVGAVALAYHGIPRYTGGLEGSKIIASSQSAGAEGHWQWEGHKGPPLPRACS